MAAKNQYRPMFPAKKPRSGVIGTHYISQEADKEKRAAMRRSKQSGSSVLDFCLRVAAPALTKEIADALASGQSVTITISRLVPASGEKP